MHNGSSTFLPSLTRVGSGHPQHEIRTKKQAGVGDTSWWVWLECPPHLNFTSYTHVI